LKVRQATLDALAYIRDAGGPFLLEIVTYRYRGHSMGDPERYRKAEEVKKYQENDPIGIYRGHLVREGIASESELDGVESLVEEETRDAIQFAESSPEPAPEELYSDIYADETAF